MTQPHTDHETKLSFAKPHRSRRFARHADVVDSVVFLIVAILLPAWILGHLYLTFFPAPAAVAGEMGDDVPAATADSEPGSSADGSDLAADDSESGSHKMGMRHSKEPDLGLGFASSGGADSNAAAAANAELEQLNEKANMLKTQVATLKQKNEQLTSENSSLKTAAQSASQDMGDPAEVDMLRQKLQSAADQLEMAKKDSLTASESLASTEQMKNQLQGRLTKVQRRLEQTEADLAAAKSKQEELMAAQQEAPLLPMAEPEPDKELMMQVQKSRDRASELESNIEKLQQDLRTSNVTLTARQQELQSANKTLATLKARNSELETALNRAQQNAATSEPAAEVYRDYVSSKGSISKMAFIRWEGEDGVIVRSFTDKRLYRLSLDRFSDADKKYLLQQK